MEKKLKAADDGRVTHEMIEKARAIYMNVYRSKAKDQHREPELHNVRCRP